VYNKAFIIGNLTRDPEMRYTPSGIAVTRFRVAVNRTFKKAENEEAEVDFISVVAWRKLAEICGEYLKKGSPVAIEGRLQINEYEKDGQQQSFSEIVADNMQMLGRKGE
jgi:single-strand DNA-binding protein